MWCYFVSYYTLVTEFDFFPVLLDSLFNIILYFFSIATFFTIFGLSFYIKSVFFSVELIFSPTLEEYNRKFQIDYLRNIYEHIISIMKCISSKISKCSYFYTFFYTCYEKTVTVVTFHSFFYIILLVILQ